MKRVFDVIVALCGLALLAPVYAAVAIAIRVWDRGPVLFKQQRVGRHFRPFEILKFRTMVVGAEAMGPTLTIGDDERITRVGRVLRQTKLDELPQLWNVLRGDMSLVGPRPEMAGYVDLYRDDYQVILGARPGITDVASILYRDESRLLGESSTPEAHYVRVILPHKIWLAKDYVVHGSVPYDLWLLITTVVCLLYPKRALDRVFEWLGRWHAPAAIACQAALVLTANAAAVAVRYEHGAPPEVKRLMWATLPILLLVRVLGFVPFRLHRSLWRYTDVQDLNNIVGSIALSSLTFWIVLRGALGVTDYSTSVLVLDAVLSIGLLAGLRLVRRFQNGLRREMSHGRRILLVGSGEPTEQVLHDLVHRGVRDVRVIGVVDRDPRRTGLRIHNVPVLGTENRLDAIIAERDPDAIVIAGASTPEERRAIVRIAARYEKPVTTVAGVSAALPGARRSSGGRSVRPEDLIPGEPVAADRETLQAAYAGRRVLITGAGGSIGAELSRQIGACDPSALILLDHHEASLCAIEQELREAQPALEIRAALGDVSDARRIAGVFAATRPDVVLHAASTKHLPLMEQNPSESLRTNLRGTTVVAQAALRWEAERFVLLSTEKAVEATSALGRAKRAAELAIEELHEAGSAAGPENGDALTTRFATVRFGNVLDAAGNAIRLFQRQIERGGPITVTHPDVTRSFLAATDAVRLILHAGAIARGGELFVLDMGKPVRVLDLARRLIRLHGLEPGRDVEITFIGLRPGERLIDKSFADRERAWKTGHPRILQAVCVRTADERRGELRALLAAFRSETTDVAALREVVA